MRTTITVDDALVEEARRLTGLKERSAVFQRGLETLVRVESAKRLASLGGSDRQAHVASRDRRDRT